MSSVVYDKLCADELTFFFIFLSCRVSIFLSREVLLECHIAVVSFDIKKCSLRSRLLCLRYRASYLISFLCFDMLLLLLLLFFFFFSFFSLLFLFLNVHGLSHLFSCTDTDCILNLFAGHTELQLFTEHQSKWLFRRLLRHWLPA